MFVVIEMLKVTEVVRYIDPPSGSTSFKVAGGGGATPNYLSVMPGADVYAPGSLASAAGFDSRPEGQPGEYRVTLNSAPSLATSPRQRLFFVEGPVTYLCDERQGTMRRYANYAVAEFQAARATPGAFGVAGELVARGLTSCNFVVDPLATAADVGRAIAASLQERDVVSHLTSSQQQKELFEARALTGPNEPIQLAALDSQPP